MIFSWLAIIILAYFFFSLSYLGDKLLLSKPQINASAYTFYVGIISIFVIVFIPFVKFVLPSAILFFWIITDAAVYIIGMYAMFVALRKFDVSRVMTTIGATQPIFIFALTWIFWGPQILGSINILAFILLLVGSFLISFEKKSKSNGRYLLITVLSAILFSLDYVFQKIIFLQTGFLEGFILIRVFVFIFALLFLFSKNNRKEIFKKQNVSSKQNWVIFIGTHSSGGIANILQAFAISLAPVAFLPIINSSRGIQYVFLFLMTIFLSIFFPKILKEKTSKWILIQKIVSIVLIVLGLALLVYNT